MLISVIIPTYNRLKWLPRCIDSVLSQTCTDYELIVVDDGSVDGSLQYLESLTPRLKVIRQPNLGAGAARNTGAKCAVGEYLAFLDSDDLWLPWTLSVFVELIQRHKYPSVMAASVQEFAEDAEVTHLAHCRTPKSEYYDNYFAASNTGYYIGSGGAIYNREIFLKAGGFGHVRFNAEDHDLALRLGLESGFVKVIEPITLAWRRHDDEATKNYSAAYEGNRYLIEQERRGAYPGGAALAHQRREIILRHLRPVALECLKKGMSSEAWNLYWTSFIWHMAQNRWKFLLGFPVKALL